jgi:nicotinamidase-related amidase
MLNPEETQMPKSALLVVDVQNIYTEREGALFCKDSVATVNRINQLIETFEKQRLPIIYVRHQHKKNGSDTGRLFDYEAEGEGEEKFNFVEGTHEVAYSSQLRLVTPRQDVVKNRYSAFKNTNLHELLKRAKVTRLAICGFMTNFCCESTAREALDLDYYVDFIVDATGTPGTEHLSENKVRSAVAEILEAGFARVFDTKDYLKGNV